MIYSRIIGTGSYLPDRVVTNHDLEKIVNTNDEWIVSRTGIRERHYAAEDQDASDLFMQYLSSLLLRAATATGSSPTGTEVRWNRPLAVTL